MINKIPQIKPLCLAIALTLSSIPTVQATSETTNPISELDWRIGPSKENVNGVASIETKEDEGFLDTPNSDKFLEYTDNLKTGTTNILVASDNSWWATFDFDDIGYVKDNDKIDADELLKQLKASDEPANKERERLGYTKIYTVGWAVAPHYDPKTNRLEWALKIRDDNNNETINYTIRILSRSGVMNATLISSEENLTQNIAAFKNDLNNFKFNAGESYAEFKAGDKVAKIGLAALIVGGAAAVATKKGFWAAIAAFFAASWKFIAVGVVAAGAWLRNLFKKKDS